LIWIIGEYAEKIENADELLATFLEVFKEESYPVSDSTHLCPSTRSVNSLLPASILSASKPALPIISTFPLFASSPLPPSCTQGLYLFPVVSHSCL